jgi:hypothetical protein
LRTGRRLKAGFWPEYPSVERDAKPDHLGKAKNSIRIRAKYEIETDQTDRVLAQEKNINDFQLWIPEFKVSIQSP